MSTQAIKDFYAAKYVLDMHAEINIPDLHIDHVMTKVGQLAQDIDWAPFGHELQHQYSRLEEYRLNVSNKSLTELEQKIKVIPDTLKQELDGLQHGTTKEIQQNVIKMLESQDWAPFRSKLQCLKLRLDDLAKKKKLDDIDRVGIINLISNITRRCIHFYCLQVYPKVPSIELLNGCVKRVEEHIATLPSCVFTRFSENSTRSVLNHACSHDTAQIPLTRLMIRSGADVNGGFFSVPSMGIFSPLCDAFAGGIGNDASIRREVLQLLLKAGANPNLTSRPTSSQFGYSTLIFDLIYMTDQDVDRLLPDLVDAGMNVDALQISSFGNSNEVTVLTPLMRAMMIGHLHDDSAVKEQAKVFTPKRLNFIRALIFNNATLHEAAIKMAEKKGLLERINKLLNIRDSVKQVLLAPLRPCLILPIVEIVSSYWSPHVPELRARCYAIEPPPPPTPIVPTSETRNNTPSACIIS